MQSLSPLRYPGGKSKLFNYFSSVIEKNQIVNGVYIEAFAGGAGAALQLLFSKKVSKIILNDLDVNVYKFWTSVLSNNNKFVQLIRDTPISVREWEKQKDVLKNKSGTVSDLKIGFAFFYLNRCNRSGIMSSGPIGGKAQDGEWKINARFNKKELIRRINAIGAQANQIKVYNEDANDFIVRIRKTKSLKKEKMLIYFDPPYYLKGRDLYKMYFTDDDHMALAQSLKYLNSYLWIMSYDKVPFITDLYKNYSKKIWLNKYSANKASMVKELIIHSNKCKLPRILN